MAMIYEGCSQDYESSLEYINIVFTSVFIMEALVKLIGFGINGYFSEI